MKKILVLTALGLLWALVLLGVFLLLGSDHLEAFASFVVIGTGLVVPTLSSLAIKRLGKKSRGEL